MNINYHLTEEEARDGLNGLLPKFDRQALILGGLFIFIALGLFANILMNGYRPSYGAFAVVCIGMGIWFLANRPIKVRMVARRSTPKDNAYMLTLSSEGWIRPGKGDKIHFTKEAHAVETPLTVSLDPDGGHIFVIPKSSMNEQRVKELCELLEAGKCPVRHM